MQSGTQELRGQENSKQKEAFVGEWPSFERVYTYFSFFLSGYFCCFFIFLTIVFIVYDYIDLICKQFWHQDCNSICFLLAESPGDGAVEFTAFYGEGQYYNPHLLVGEAEAQKGNRMTSSSRQ